ncbi:hypothetical protein BVRB_2g045670 [Beta vulgaris subsp. vulgaris]|uniref:Cyclic nucleotide-binding domain-containing protein n=1 Tax=Beta vulgaris subsp. vulgaris TaxID=3555 RepID=A0A0J8BH53_BETVV|nr:hypothetical protein BVRB_2g045670 [Beta vulgaris subsp. vulgaris]
MASGKNLIFKEVFDPNSEFIVKWYKLTFVVGLINFVMDPMFLYVLTFSNSSGLVVLNYDLPLGATLAILRTLGDFFLILGIMVKFRTAFEAPGSKLFNRRKLILEPRLIALKYCKSTFMVDLLAVLPLPQIVGAMYYYFHIYRLLACVEIVSSKCKLKPRNLRWDQLLFNCTQNSEIEEGLFSSALKNKISSRNFIQRYMFCFSFGLKSLSSLGQNFNTSFSTLETTFSIFVTLYGLIFFADLITRMQAGIQSMEEREEQQRARQREVNEWMDYHQLPLHLKARIDHAIQSEWTENGIDDEVLLASLPMDLRSEIRKYLYMDSVCKLPKFADMESPLVEAVCQHLKTFSCKESTYIVYEGDIVKQMVFIFSGQLELSFTDKGNSSLTILGPGECCGQELVTWASQPTTSMDNLPPSTWTIKCLTDVEAFVLHAYDMKILATQFAHNQEFQRAFKQHYP